MTGWQQLLRLELKRIWNLFTLVGVGFFTFLGVMISSSMRHPDAHQILLRTHTGLLVIVTALFAIGVVANDIKEGWLRTLLVRPIRREHYLAVRILAIFISALIALLVVATLPVLITLINSGRLGELNLFRVMGFYLLFACQILLVIMMATALSCWVPGAFNVFLLGAWAMVAGFAEFQVRTRYWDTMWIVTLQEFLLPGGFSETIEALGRHSVLQWDSLLWGVAALAGFTAFAFWSITRVRVDTTSE